MGRVWEEGEGKQGRGRLSVLLRKQLEKKSRQQLTKIFHTE